MAKKKISRKELLKKPDEFMTFSGKAIAFYKEHSRQFEYVGMAIVGLFLLYLGINTYLKYVNKKGQEAYHVAYESVVKSMDAETNQEELKKAGVLFNEVIDKYGLSKASKLALAESAYIHFLNKEHDEAVSQYLTFLDKWPGNDPYNALTHLAVAACYEEKGDLGMAIQHLEQVSSSPQDYFQDQAIFNMARIHRLAKETEKSDTLLSEFIEKYPSSPFLPQAKALVQAIPTSVDSGD
ncbi:MAG: tetratricopeptide repeat protein [Deltaproteobacteria bacterium]|nr:tetratricopeptide repeat protein [Deltaproteobacteria bacterium]